MTEDQIEAFRRDGVVVVRGVFKDWVDVMAEGVARNMAEPGEYASENAVSAGRFFDDYCNWTRIPEFERMVRESPAAELAATAMKSTTAQFFHDHVLVKEPGTPKPTPWHQDSPYYFVEGRQTVSQWIPLDPVREASLRFIAGSHLWDKMVRPVSWADDSDFYDAKRNGRRCRTRMRTPTRPACWNGRWSRAMSCCSITVPHMARAAICRAPGGGRCPCAGSATMRVM